MLLPEKLPRFSLSSLLPVVSTTCQLLTMHPLWCSDHPENNLWVVRRQEITPGVWVVLLVCSFLQVGGEGLNGYWFLPGSLVYELICCRLDKYQTWSKEDRTVHLGEEDAEQGFPFQWLAVKLTLTVNTAQKWFTITYFLALNYSGEADPSLLTVWCEEINVWLWQAGWFVCVSVLCSW